jgi:hypothetical protein
MRKEVIRRKEGGRTEKRNEEGGNKKEGGRKEREKE